MIENDATLNDAARARFAKRFAAVSSTDRKRIHRLLLAEMKKHPREGNDNRDCLGARLSIKEKARLKDLALIRQTTPSALIREAVRDKYFKSSDTTTTK